MSRTINTRTNEIAPLKTIVACVAEPYKVFGYVTEILECDHIWKVYSGAHGKTKRRRCFACADPSKLDAQERRAAATMVPTPTVTEAGL